MIITWDEATVTFRLLRTYSPGDNIATIVVSANNKGLVCSLEPVTTRDVASTQESYGVRLLLGGSSNSVNGDLTGAFGSAPTTGSIGGTVTDAQTSAGITGHGDVHVQRLWRLGGRGWKLLVREFARARIR